MTTAVPVLDALTRTLAPLLPVWCLAVPSGMEEDIPASGMCGQRGRKPISGWGAWSWFWTGKQPLKAAPDSVAGL